MAQRVDWGEALEGSARELIAVEEPDTAGGAAEDVESFLIDTLKDGPVATRDLKAEAANAHGLSWRTLNRAKKRLGVKVTKGGFGAGAGWSWQLPDPPKDASEGAEGC